MKQNHVVVHIIISVIVVLMLSPNLFAQRYLNQTSNNGYDMNYRGFTHVDFVDANNGCAAAGRYILKTTDGGKQWQQQINTTTPWDSAVCIAMYSSQSASFVNGRRDGSIWTTRDGGGTWSQFNGPRYLYNISAYKGTSTSIAVGEVIQRAEVGARSGVCITTDEGSTWTQLYVVGAQNDLVGVSMGSETTAIAFDTTEIYYSNDGTFKTWLKGALDPNSLGTSPGMSNTGILNGKKLGQMVNSTIGYAAFVKPKGAIAWTTNGGVSWIRRDTTAGLPNTRSMSFFNAGTGVIITDSSDIRLTRDSAKTWIKQSSLIPFFGNGSKDVQFVSDDVIIVVGDKGKIIRSTDTGKTWTVVAGVEYADHSIAVLSTGIGIAVGSDFMGATLISRTTNGGINWNKVQSPSVGNLISVAFTSDSIVVALSVNDYFIRSTDAGLSWSSKSLVFGATKIAGKISFLPKTGFGVAVSSQGKCARTTDSGATWDIVSTGTTKILRDVIIKKFDSTYIYACGDSGTVVYSVDLGNTWSSLKVTLPQINRLFSIDIPDSLTVIVAGDSVQGTNPALMPQKVYRYDKREGIWLPFYGTFGTGGLSQVKALSPSSIVCADKNGFFKSTDGGNSWGNITLGVWQSEKTFGADIKDIYPVSSGDIYFAVSGSQIWRRIQGDYPALSSVVDFGNVITTQSITKHIPITNSGADTLTLSGIKILNSPDIFIYSQPTSLTLLPGVTDIIHISFSPQEAIDYETLLFLRVMHFRERTILFF